MEAGVGATLSRSVQSVAPLSKTVMIRQCRRADRARRSGSHRRRGFPLREARGAPAEPRSSRCNRLHTGPRFEFSTTRRLADIESVRGRTPSSFPFGRKPCGSPSGPPTYTVTSCKAKAESVVHGIPIVDMPTLDCPAQRRSSDGVRDERSDACDGPVKTSNTGRSPRRS